jgi:NAD(P) transhydrogenase subunit alpha
MRIAVPKEITAGEQRVATVPDVVGRLVKLGVEVLVEAGAGAGAFQSDEAYAAAGAKIVADAAGLYRDADVVLKVQPPTLEEVEALREGTILIGLLAPHKNRDVVARLRDRRLTSLALELIPRISRAQAMDALSSQASVAGYRAVLMAAYRLGKFMPMLTTPTGTIRPARFLIIGVGVAGLQAIATARRLGAMVEAYDVRPATKEQVESLGAKFIQMDIKADARGGYARELTAEEKQQQQALIAKHVAQADAVITTAAVPGRQAPRIITVEMVEQMRAGSVIIDLAAESGGNCELTKADKGVRYHDVEICGPVNVASTLSTHASEMYAKNMLNLLQLMIKDGRLAPDWEDEVLRDSTLTRDGEIKFGPIRTLIEGGQS